MRVPDGIEPIVGYRCWSYTVSLDGVSLFPLSRFGAARSATSAWAGAESRWVEARCLSESAFPPHFPSQILRDILGIDPGAAISSLPHEVPMEDCSCGFYAMRDLVPELVGTISAALLRPPIQVLGRVLLSGKVIEHAEGYRAERARIAELIPWKGTERTVTRIATALGLPMGAAV